MKVYVVGGFLGAGKTSAIRALARKLAELGERVAVITNDQGHALVDTALVREDVAIVREIGGGCFCCRYPELESALLGTAEAGASVTIAEAVGSCTDLVATVLSPLAERHGDRFRVAPLAIVVDPWRVRDIARGAFNEDVAYLFRKQLEEADVILVSRADASPPDVGDVLREIRSDAAIVAISGRTGAGMSAWLSAAPQKPAAPLVIDYDRYAAAEADLGWLNARVHVTATRAFAPRSLILDVLGALRELPIAHLKIATIAPTHGTAALVRQGGEPGVALDALPAETERLELLVNARVAMSAAALAIAVKEAVLGAAAGATVEWTDLESFEPSRPVPVHRYTYRCGSGDDASCCAAFYDRPEVRFLLGDSWHPGGAALTLAQGAELDLTAGAKVLDVACGRGESLRVLRSRFAIEAMGLDAGDATGDEDVRIVRGDAHHVPFDDQVFDAVLCECAMSTFVDPRGALLEMRRVIKPTRRIAVSDMIVEGPIPELLRPYAHTGACFAGARTERGWLALFADAGLEVVRSSDESRALAELVSGIKRRLVGAALGRAAGALPAGITLDVKKARALIRAAEDVLGKGHVRYGAWILARA